MYVQYFVKGFMVWSESAWVSRFRVRLSHFQVQVQGNSCIFDYKEREKKVEKLKS